MLKDYCDGRSCKAHPLFSVDISALQIILYFDEVEVCNPLGTKKNIHTLGVFIHNSSASICLQQRVLEHYLLILYVLLCMHFALILFCLCCILLGPTFHVRIIYTTETRAITNIIDCGKVGCPEKWSLRLIA